MIEGSAEQHIVDNSNLLRKIVQGFFFFGGFRAHFFVFLYFLFLFFFGVGGGVLDPIHFLDAMEPYYYHHRYHQYHHHHHHITATILFPHAGESRDSPTSKASHVKVVIIWGGGEGDEG